MDENETIRYGEELKQSLSRFGYIALFSPILIYLNTISHINIYQLNLLYITYTSFSTINFIFIKTFPNHFVKGRRYIISTLDILAVSFLISYLEYYGFIFTIIYQWIILSSLIRFGKEYMYFSMSITLVSITMIYIFNPYWHQHFDAIVYMYLLVTIIPMFVFRLIKRLLKENEELSKLLNLVKKKSKLDPLTMIPNRFSFELELKKYISRNIPFYLFNIE